MIVCLEISNYIGSIGASHYYGRLRGGDKRVDLEYKLSQAQATKLNKIDGKGYTWKRGSTTSRFESEEDIIQAALAQYKTYFPGALALVLGDYSSAGPKWTIDGPPELLGYGNDLWQEAEDMSWWDYDPTLMDRICNEWEKLIKPYEAGILPEKEPERPPEEAKIEQEAQPKKKGQSITEFYEQQEYEEIELTVRCRTTFDRKAGKGFLNFFMSDCVVSEDGRTLGSIKGDVSAYTWISKEGDDRPWRIGADDIWYAFLDALEKHDSAHATARVKK